MLLIYIIDGVLVALLVGIAVTKGFEASLPVAAFLLMLFPNESQIQLPGLFELTTQRIVIVVLSVLYLACAKKHRHELPLKYLLALQIAWMLVSTLHSVVFTISLKTVLSQVFDYFVPFYIFGRSITQVKTIHKILAAFVCAITVCCVFGAFEAYGYGSITSVFPPVVHRFDGDQFEGERGTRVAATFGHPILFGAAISLAIPLALYLLTLAKTSTQKVLLWCAIMLMALNVYKTSSRGAWMATVMSVAILSLLGLNRVRKYTVVIVLLSITVLAVRPGVWDTISNNYVATLDPESPQGSSYEWRYALYGIARRELARDFGRSLWGYGPESFFYLKLEGDFQGHTVPFESCDSSVAAIMIETGYAGLAITAILLLKGLLVALRGFRKLPRPRNLLPLVLFTNMVAFCFLMSNVALFGWGQQTHMFWILLSLAMIYPRLARQQAMSRRKEMSPQALLSVAQLALK